MQNITRRVEEQLQQDLDKKMVFIAGPRQVGKTTLAEKLSDSFSSRYYSWDILEHRKLIKENTLDLKSELWIFDEIHKYRQWRNWLKGCFDLHKSEHKILVTGSAKLDVYNRGGDSLQGRYFFHRLHPFTLSEVLGIKFNGDIDAIPLLTNEPNIRDSQSSLETLLRLSGFPEPFLSQSVIDFSRWQLSYGHRLVQEDIRNLEKIIELDKMETLYEHLPKTVGSILSINSLREDLEVNHRTVSNWIKIFEKNYACFRIPPFGTSKIKAVKKEQKLYMWNSALAEKDSAKFENLIALHLLRLCHYITDLKGIKCELRYFRDTKGREVDFIIMKNNKAWMAIEVKESEQDLDSNLKYLLERSEIPYAFQLHLNGNLHKKLPNINKTQIQIMPASQFLVNLP